MINTQDPSGKPGEAQIEQFAGSLRGWVEPDVVVDGWVRVVSEAMQPSFVAVWVRQSMGGSNDGTAPKASGGHDPAPNITRESTDHVLITDS